VTAPTTASLTHAARTGPSAREGFTLIEAVMSTLIVSTLIVASLHMFGSLARGRQVVLAGYTGDGVARQLLSEIIQNRFEEPDETVVFGPEGSETARSSYDDVDDYHGWSAGPPEARDGTAIAHLTGWQRSVTVENVDTDTLASAGGTRTGLKKITVTVTDPAGRQSSITALRCDTSGYDQDEPESQTTYVAWAGVTLQVGPDPSTRMYSGTHTPNLVP